MLSRPNFKFYDLQINFLLDRLEKDGISVIPTSLPQVPFPDESDRVFYEVAKFCNTPLVTGNLKHYPKEDCIVTVSDFYGNFYVRLLTSTVGRRKYWNLIFDVMR